MPSLRRLPVLMVRPTPLLALDCAAPRRLTEGALLRLETPSEERLAGLLVLRLLLLERLTEGLLLERLTEERLVVALLPPLPLPPRCARAGVAHRARMRASADRRRLGLAKKAFFMMVSFLICVFIVFGLCFPFFLLQKYYKRKR